MEVSEQNIIQFYTKYQFCCLGSISVEKLKNKTSQCKFFHYFWCFLYEISLSLTNPIWNVLTQASQYLSNIQSKLRNKKSVFAAKVGWMKNNLIFVEYSPFAGCFYATRFFILGLMEAKAGFSLLYLTYQLLWFSVHRFLKTLNSHSIRNF